MTKAQIEKTYGVKIRDDSFYNPRTGKSVKQYRIYSADGCQWENGLRSMADVERECKEWVSELKEIAGKSMSENKKAVKAALQNESLEEGARDDVDLLNLSHNDIITILDTDGSKELEKKLTYMPTGSKASFIGRDSFGTFETVGVKKGDYWSLISHGISGDYEGEDFNDVEYSTPSNFAYWINSHITGYKVNESIKEDLENLETEEDTVAMPQPMVVAKEESEDLWQKFLDATEEPKDAPLFGAEDQPTPDEVEEPKAELEESLSSKLTLDESLFENKKTLKEGVKEEKAALREVQKQLRRLLIEIKDSQKSISSYAKGNGNYTDLIDDLYEARNGLLGAIDDIDNLIFEDHQLSSRRNESLKLKEGYSVVDLETGDRFGNYDDIEEAKSKAYRYATMFKAECAVINDRMRPVCGFRSNGREISLKGLGESFKKKLKEANGADGQLFNGQKDIADSFKNYKAFKANFKPVHIVKVNGNYFVFNEDAQDSNSYIYYSNNKDNIEGWLYGAVQAKNKRIAEGLKKKNKKSVKENFYLKTKNPKKKLNEAYITKDFDEFEPWSGAVEVWEKILDEDKLDDLERFVDDVYSGVIGETELNDLLRFDSDYVYDVLGMSAEEDIDESLSKKRLKEGYAPDIIADLEDRARSIMSDGSDLEDAIRGAIDDGLIYTEDIVDLAVHYGAIDSSIIDDFYEDLFNDMYSDLEDEVNEEEDDWEDEEDDDIDESLNERNLTRAERHNKEMNKIFSYKKATDDAMKDFLVKNGVSEDEAEELYQQDKLGLKLRDLGLNDEFFDMWQSKKGDYDKSGQFFLKEKMTSPVKYKVWNVDWLTNGYSDEEYDFIETLPTEFEIVVDEDLVENGSIDYYNNDIYWVLYYALRNKYGRRPTDFEFERIGEVKLKESKSLKGKKRNLKEASSDKKIEAARKTKEKLAKKYDVSETSIVWLGGKNFVVTKDGKEIRVNADEALKEASTLPRGGKDEDFDTDAWSVIYWELSADSEDSTSTRNMKKLAKTSANAKNKYERVDPVNDTDLRVYAKDENGFKLAKKVANAWKVKYEIEPTKKSHQAKFPDERLQMTIFIPEEMLG